MPKKDKTINEVAINCRIGFDLAIKLTRRAKKEDRSVSSVIRLALTQYLETKQ